MAPVTQLSQAAEQLILARHLLKSWQTNVPDHAAGIALRSVIWTVQIWVCAASMQVLLDMALLLRACWRRLCRVVWFRMHVLNTAWADRNVASCFCLCVAISWHFCSTLVEYGG